MSAKLGKRQLAILQTMAGRYPNTGRPGYQRSYPGGGWVWENHSTTITILESLHKQGLVDRDTTRIHDPVYRINKRGLDIAAPDRTKGALNQLLGGCNF